MKNIKKLIFGVIISVFMVLCIPTKGLANQVFILIGDEHLDGTNTVSVTDNDGGTATFDKSTYTLTLNDFDFEGNTEIDGMLFGIYVNHYDNTPINIVINGENNINMSLEDGDEGDYVGAFAFAINSAGAPISITGDGTLNLNCDGIIGMNAALYSDGSIGIDGPTINAYAGESEQSLSAGIWTNCDLNIQNSTINANASTAYDISAGIEADGDITFVNSNIDAIADISVSDISAGIYTNGSVLIDECNLNLASSDAKLDSYGLYSSLYDREVDSYVLDINDSELVINSGDSINAASAGIYLPGGSFKLAGESLIEITTGSSTYEINGMYVDGSLIINGGNISIESVDDTTPSAVGILTNDKLSISNANVDIDLAGAIVSSTGLYCISENLEIEDSIVNINTGDSESLGGIFTQNSLIINSSIVDLNLGNATTENDYVLFAYGNIDINNSEVTINALSENSVGIHLDDDETALTISNSIIELTVEGVAFSVNPDNLIFDNYTKICVLVDEDGDSSKAILWDEESELNNYKYIKISNVSAAGKVVVALSDKKVSILSDNIKELIPLTDEEQRLVDYGYDVSVRFEVVDTVSEEEQKLVNDNLGDYTFGKLISINIYKKVGYLDEAAVTDLNGNVILNVIVDDELVNDNEYIDRTYNVLRVHNGEVEVLDVTFNSNNNQVSFESDKFSTYALVYSDTDNTPVEPLNENLNNTAVEPINNSTGNPKTYDNIKLYISLISISALGIVSVITYIKKRSLS